MRMTAYLPQFRCTIHACLPTCVLTYLRAYLACVATIGTAVSWEIVEEYHKSGKHECDWLQYDTQSNLLNFITSPLNPVISILFSFLIFVSIITLSIPFSFNNCILQSKQASLLSTSNIITRLLYARIGFKVFNQVFPFSRYHFQSHIHLHLQFFPSKS